MNQPSHSPPPPPLNQPSLITPLPEIPISILISRHLSTKPIKPTQPHTIQDLIEQKSWKTLADVTADQIIQTDLNETQNLLQNWLGIVSKSQVWIENGDVRSLETYLSSMDHHSLLDTFLCVAKGDWNRCEVKCQEALQNDTLLQLDSNSRILFQNSLALSLLYQGKISEALEIMKTLIDSLNENTLLNSLVFNLVTILELRSIHAQEDKLNLLNQLQNQFSIESLNPIVFKLD
ncbi:uncharacterized protein MELLADRAFT_106589 [Melampsora larici-populina 98AG31]|uniref:Uncharacterized protein n=1 Tax=Melampsora larici-populina (strain 98AG31 / pathotype 3-4-7) TaxID=747676 RepID=F4RM01_MELLP|nr:uncharacterized protein MELLADRAFT_106589 [Melampsora larici-populina 98AG31]EGG06675.1 hypothetical protein MELLADRAFT_106589 [Melampsora larici-populina 98AG31]